METLLCVSSDSFLLAALGPDVHPGLPFFSGVSFQSITVGRETIALGDAICMGVFQLSCYFSILHGGLFCGSAWESQGEMNNSSWRYGLIQGRYKAISRRFRYEAFRCAATRRHTLGTGVIMQTEYPEKRGLNAVHTTNKYRVFQCTVNWARARLKTTFIDIVAAESSRISSVAVRDVHGAEYEFSINSLPVYLCQPRT